MVEGREKRNNDLNMFPFLLLDECQPKDWFAGSPALDKQICGRFGGLLNCAAACELDSWRNSAEGSLAEIIVLDQFSRNIHRGDPKAFAQDPLALALAQEAIRKGFHRELVSPKLAFLFMPFMHSGRLIQHVRVYSSVGCG